MLLEAGVSFHHTWATVLVESLLLLIALCIPFQPRKWHALLRKSLSSAASAGATGNQASREVKEQPRGLSLMDLNGDVLYEICTAVAIMSASTAKQRRASREVSPLHAFSMVNKRLRTFASPFLLRNIRIGHDWTWYKALKAVNSIEHCHAARRVTHTFYIDLYVGPDNRGPPPPEILPMKVARTIHGLRNLRKVTMILPAYHAQPFQNAFAAFNVHLPHVHTLILGPHMDWIVPMCPQVETISTHDWRWLHSDIDDDRGRRHSFDLIKSAANAPKLRHFEMVAWWDKSLLEAVIEHLPHISSLAMTGDRYHDRLAVLLPLLKRLSHLRILTLAGITALGLEHSRDGAYQSVDDRRRSRMDRRRELRVIQDAATMVFDECADLKTVWIGDQTCASRPPSGSEGEIELQCISRNGPTRWSKG